MSQLFGMDFLNMNNRVNQAQKSEKTEDIKNTKNTLGKPEISDAASSYYEELKSKYSDVEFVLVDDSQTAHAQDYAAKMHSDKNLIVCISESELEAMATDEATRSKNEGLISDALVQLPAFAKQLEEADIEVENFGMVLESDGSVSYFAVLDKANEAQKERIEKAREDKQAEKTAEKVSEKEKTTHKGGLTKITASSLEELMKKLQDTLYEAKADTVLTEQEKMVGQHFDIKF